MATDPRISLAVEPAKITPLGDLMSTSIRNREGLQQILLNKQREDLYNEETRQHQIANDQALKKEARTAADQAIVMEAHKKNPGNWKAIREEVAGQITPEYLDKLEKSNLEMEQANKAKQTADHLEMKERADAIGSEAEALLTYKDDDPNLQPAYERSLKYLTDNGYVKPGAMPAQYPGRAATEAALVGAKGAAYQAGVHLKQRQAETAKLKEDKDRAQQKLEEAAAEHTTVVDEEGHQAWLQRWGNDPDIGQRVQQVKDFDPDTTPSIVQNMAVPAKDRLALNLRKIRIEQLGSDDPKDWERIKAIGERDDATPDQIRKGKVAASSLADWDKRQKDLQAAKEKKATAGGKAGGVVHDAQGFTAGQVKTDQVRHDQLQAQESAQWRLAQDFATILAGKDDNKMVTDPSAPHSPAKPLGEVRESFMQQMNKARAAATDLQTRKMQIRGIHHWDIPPAGGTAPAATAPAQPAATPSPTPAPVKATAAPAAVVKPYETKLSPGEETSFQAWKKKNAPSDSGEDYDLRGAFMADQAGKLPRDERGHTTDQFKKPNHPTFSTESQYSGKNGNVGGRWAKEGSTDVFYPSETNLKNYSMKELQSYFKKNEPGVKLVFTQPMEKVRAYAKKYGMTDAEAQKVFKDQGFTVK